MEVLVSFGLLLYENFNELFKNGFQVLQKKT